jgi:DNA-binding NtrC family response regulator
MSKDLQVKLLRVLETGTIMRVGLPQPIVTDVRVIAATNRQPEKAVAEGKLRDDLYHRLNVFPIQMPSLHERGPDIELLAQYFLDMFNKEEGTHKRFSQDALNRLYDYSWPGNVRELKNCVHRAFIMADEVIGVLRAEDSQSPVAVEDPTLLTVRVGTPLDDIERRVTMATLAQCGNVKRRAAEVLGISVKTLYNRLEAYAASDTTAREILSSDGLQQERTDLRA